MHWMWASRSGTSSGAAGSIGLTEMNAVNGRPTATGSMTAP
jgi:hypothetical protein